MSSHPYIDITKAILHCRPAATFAVYDNDYDRVVWNDVGSKPSLEELESVWKIIKKDVEFENIRSKRTVLLMESDYTQLPDYNKKDKEAWAIYRQELRDLPNKFLSMEEIIWPNKPS